MRRSRRRPADDTEAFRRAFLAEIHAKHPPFGKAVHEDARTLARFRGERSTFRSKPDAIIHMLRLAWVSDAYFAQVLVRAKTRLIVRGVPVLPRLLHRWAMATAQVCVGDPVVLHPGVCFPHGQVVLDGLTEVGSGTVFMPWITVGLQAGNFQGPTIGRNVTVGNGAKLVGPITVGDNATIGPNSVVVHDVGAGVTVEGLPAVAVAR